MESLHIIIAMYVATFIVSIPYAYKINRTAFIPSMIPLQILATVIISYILITLIWVPLVAWIGITGYFILGATQLYTLNMLRKQAKQQEQFHNAIEQLFGENK